MLYVCLYCCQTGLDLVNLRPHISYRHLHYTPYECRMCGVVAASSAHISMHLHFEHKIADSPNYIVYHGIEDNELKLRAMIMECQKHHFVTEDVNSNKNEVIVAPFPEPLKLPTIPAPDSGASKSESPIAADFFDVIKQRIKQTSPLSNIYNRENNITRETNDDIDDECINSTSQISRLLEHRGMCQSTDSRQTSRSSVESVSIAPGNGITTETSLHQKFVSSVSPMNTDDNQDDTTTPVDLDMSDRNSEQPSTSASLLRDDEESMFDECNKCGHRIRGAARHLGNANFMKVRRYHVDRHHMTKRAYACAECSFNASEKAALIRHIGSYHKGCDAKHSIIRRSEHMRELAIVTAVGFYQSACFQLNKRSKRYRSSNKRDMF